MKTLSALRRFCALALLLASLASAAPVVIWHSDDVRGGESVMLSGEDFVPGQTRVVGLRLTDRASSAPATSTPSAVTPPRDAEPVTILQATAQTLIINLPARWSPGLYALWIGTGNNRDWSAPVFLNRANAEWLSHSTAQPGEELRLVGRILSPSSASVTGAAPATRSPSSRISLHLPDGHWRDLPVTASDKYSLHLTLPADLSEGSYELRAHNGFGGDAGWGDAVALTVKKREPWPTGQFDVRQLGALGDGQTDDTPAVERALAAATQQGGGVVWFPAGVYKLTRMLTMPERTVLRGAGQQEVTLFWPKAKPGDPEPAPAVIVGERNFGLEDLTLVFQIQQHGILAPFEPRFAKKSNPLTGNSAERLAAAGGVFVNRCTIRHLRYSPRVVKGDHRLDGVPVGASGGVTLGLAGPGIAVTGCDIVSWGQSLLLMNVREGLIAGNSLGNGRNGWYCLSGAQETIFENNRITGRDLESTGGGVNRDFPARMQLHHVYLAHNHYSDFYGGEREAMTFDSTSPGDRRWLGRVQSATGNHLTVAGQTWPKDAMTGLQCLIVSGRGLGQVRTITGNDGADLQLDSAWSAAPDATSVADLLFLPHEVIVYDNDFRDSSVSVQLYGASYDFVVDHNTSTRAGGFWGYATFYAPIPKYQPKIWNHLAPMFFPQFLHNTVNDGFVYHQGPMTGGADVGGMIGLAANPWNPEGMPVAVGYGLVIRGNTLANHASIIVRTGFDEPAAPPSPVIHQALIEGNSLQRTATGIAVGPGTDGVVVRENSFAEVATPVANLSAPVTAPAISSLADRH